MNYSLNISVTRSFSHYIYIHYIFVCICVDVNLTVNTGNSTFLEEKRVIIIKGMSSKKMNVKGKPKQWPL